MKIDEDQLKKFTSVYNVTYEFNKEVIKDFAKLLVAINYITDIPPERWHSKVSFSTVKSITQATEFLNRSSLPIPILIAGHSINKKFKIGSWIFQNLGIPYPHPIYQIFPPKFGKNHIVFMERMMAMLNASGMCKKDWELLLNFIDTDVMIEVDKKDFKDLIDIAYNALYECYLAERYDEIQIRPGKK